MANRPRVLVELQKAVEATAPRRRQGMARDAAAARADDGRRAGSPAAGVGAAGGPNPIAHSPDGTTGAGATARPASAQDPAGEPPHLKAPQDCAGGGVFRDSLFDDLPEQGAPRSSATAPRQEVSPARGAAPENAGAAEGASAAQEAFAVEAMPAPQGTARTAGGQHGRTAGGQHGRAAGGQRGRGAPSASGAASADMTEGHRERLRARFDRGETLADYELLELVLFRPIPRRDTKPVAKAMIARFGSFAAAVSAPAGQLMEIDGVGPRVVSDFRLIRKAAERFAHAELMARRTLSSTDAVAEYYRTVLRAADREEFHVLFLDKKNRFLASECAGVGTVDHTPVYPREVLSRALAHGASAIVLVHNHPSGDPTPSRADVAMTRQIVEATAPVGIAVHDHVIVGGTRFVSLRGEGLM